MPRWNEIKKEIDNRKDVDGPRREKIRLVEEITGRPLIVYASAFLDESKVAIAKGELSIVGADKVGFTEVLEQIEGDSLDILIHSPGGSPEAAESIIELLRSRFSSLRFIVPDQAKSAATMMCCASDLILMDEKSELGPIDPQLLVIRADKAQIWAPAQAILDQFDKAKQSISEHSEQLPAWLPILQTLGPSLLSICEQANALSRSLVKDWLIKYMLSDQNEKEQKAQRIVEFLLDSKIHLSHGRRIGMDALISEGVSVYDMRKDPKLQSAIWDLYLTIKWTFDLSTAVKIIENGHGGAYIRQVEVKQIGTQGNNPIPRQNQQPVPVSGKKRRR